MDLYSKYRPKKLADLVGQKHVVATLKKSTENDRFSHAYIFSGEKGTGKTSTSRILSCLLNDEVENGDIKDPSSKISKAIFSGAMPDVIELDGAKHRKVEDIENLLELANFAPISAKKKIYIIDECHQLSSTAISALLKIVEEPPSYLTFIFCTTEFNKIPDTIVSRSQSFRFNKISSEDIFGRLKFISEEESINIEDDALYGISNLSNGSLRDAIGMLQQIWTAAGDSKIKSQHIYRYFGKNDKNGVVTLFESILSKNVIESLSNIAEVHASNCDFSYLLNNLSELFRECMCYKVDDRISIDPEMKKIYDKYINNIDVNVFIRICDIFSKINHDLEYNINKRWVMESFVIECINNID